MLILKSNLQNPLKVQFLLPKYFISSGKIHGNTYTQRFVFVKSQESLTLPGMWLTEINTVSETYPEHIRCTVLASATDRHHKQQTHKKFPCILYNWCNPPV